MSATPHESRESTWWRTLLVRWTERRAQRAYRKLMSSMPVSTLAELSEVPHASPRPAAPRAVPVAVEPLTAALDLHPGARNLFRHLVIVEQTLRLAKGDPFSFIPASVLAQAVKQLDVVAGHGSHPGLRLLHLQMRRRHSENEARAQAESEGRVTKWDPRQPMSQEARLAAMRERLDVNGWMPGDATGGGGVVYRIRRDVLSELPGDDGVPSVAPLPFEDTQPYAMPEPPLAAPAAGGRP